MGDTTSLKTILVYGANVLVLQFYSANDTNWSRILLRALLLLVGQGALYQLFLYPFVLDPLRRLPVAKGFLPIIGHSQILFSKPNGSGHLQIVKDTPNDGLILTRSLFHMNRLIATTPTTLADVLVHKSYDFQKPAWVRNFLRRFLGDGLLITEGEEHKHHRKLIMPAFHFRHIKELYPVFWSKSMELCDAVRAVIHEDPSKIHEIGHYATQVTLDIIGLAGLGRDIGSLHNGEDELIATYEEILEPTTEKVVYFFLHLVLPSWFIKALPWKINQRTNINTGRLKRICTDFVTAKKSAMKTGEDSDKASSRDILSIMIRTNNFSNENLVDQLLTFLAAGHETTSSALTWATYLLSLHPDMQTRLRAEIHQFIPDPAVLSEAGFDVAGVLESMPYLNGVCSEVLRLYPTVPLTTRVAVRDTTVGGHFIPKDTQIFIGPWAINRNPKLWGSDAEEFVPDRWIDKATGRATMNGGADSNYAFLTFLHGPRSCIGEKFARAELRALLAAFVGSFAMEMADPTEKIIVAGTITVKAKNGMKLRLTPVAWPL